MCCFAAVRCARVPAWCDAAAWPGERQLYVPYNLLAYPAGVVSRTIVGDGETSSRPPSREKDCWTRHELSMKAVPGFPWESKSPPDPSATHTYWS